MYQKFITRLPRDEIKKLKRSKGGGYLKYTSVATASVENFSDGKNFREKIITAFKCHLILVPIFLTSLNSSTAKGKKKDTRFQSHSPRKAEKSNWPGYNFDWLGQEEKSWLLFQRCQGAHSLMKGSTYLIKYV